MKKSLRSISSWLLWYISCIARVQYSDDNVYTQLTPMFVCLYAPALTLTVLYAVPHPLDDTHTHRIAPTLQIVFSIYTQNVHTFLCTLCCGCDSGVEYCVQEYWGRHTVQHISGVLLYCQTQCNRNKNSWIQFKICLHLEIIFI